MLYRLILLMTVASLMIASVPVSALSGIADDDTSTNILITEVQTMGQIDDSNDSTVVADDAKAEFIELYNDSDKAVDIEGWQLQFLTADHDGIAAPTRILGNLSGQLAAHDFLLYAYDGYYQEYLPNTFETNYYAGSLPQNGSVRLIDTDGVQHDLLGWGSAMNFLGHVAEIPISGTSLQRCVQNDGRLLVAADNDVDFKVYNEPSIAGLLPCPSENADDEGETSPPDVTPVPDGSLSCEGVELSEVLPNPEGADSGNEFIELYNPTDELISLRGCALQTSASSKLFILPDVALADNTYTTFFSDTTELSLPNVSGGTVWLISADNTEISSVTYPQSMDDNASWSNISGSWQTTFAPTPNATNMPMSQKPCPAGQERNAETGRCHSQAIEEAITLGPCGPGQQRNLETNRCRSVLGASTSLTPCKSGQYRNPETGRCKSQISSVADLVPCKPDQQRNPATNRCRSSATLGAQLTPCKAGYVRNTETNRCKKSAVSTADIPKVTDVQSQVVNNPKSWWVTGAIVAVVMAYGVYEWRIDIMQQIRRLRKQS